MVYKVHASVGPILSYTGTNGTGWVVKAMCWTVMTVSGSSGYSSVWTLCTWQVPHSNQYFTALLWDMISCITSRLFIFNSTIISTTAYSQKLMPSFFWLCKYRNRFWAWENWECVWILCVRRCSSEQDKHWVSSHILPECTSFGSRADGLVWDWPYDFCLVCTLTICLTDQEKCVSGGVSISQCFQSDVDAVVTMVMICCDSQTIGLTVNIYHGTLQCDRRPYPFFRITHPIFLKAWFLVQWTCCCFLVFFMTYAFRGLGVEYVFCFTVSWVDGL